MAALLSIGGEIMSKTFDRIAGVIFLLLGILFIIESQKISESAYGSVVGPSVVPTGLGILLILLSVRLVSDPFKYKTDEKGQKKEEFQYKKFGIILASTIIYIILLEHLGYVLSTFLFLFAAFQTMEQGKWIRSIIIASLFSFSVYYIFAEFLGGTLPRFSLF